MIFNGLTLFFIITFFWGGLIVGKCLSREEVKEDKKQEFQGRASFKSPLVTWIN